MGSDNVAQGGSERPGYPIPAGAQWKVDQGMGASGVALPLHRGLQRTGPLAASEPYGLGVRVLNRFRGHVIGNQAPAPRNIRSRSC